MSVYFYDANYQFTTFVIDYGTNDIYVYDGKSYGIQKIDANKNITLFSNDSNWNIVMQIIFDSKQFSGGGYMYLLTTDNIQSITIYQIDSNGNSLLYYNNLSYLFDNVGVGAFSIDTNNNIYYGGNGNQDKLFKLDPSLNSTEIISNTFTNIFNLTNDNLNNIYLTQTTDNSIAKYDSNGNLINTRFIYLPNKYPMRICCDNKNYFYVGMQQSFINYYDVNTHCDLIGMFDSNGTFIKNVYTGTNSNNYPCWLNYNEYSKSLFFSNIVGYFYSVDVSLPCFLKGTKILAVNNDIEQYIKIEDLKPGDIVKTHLHGNKKIHMIGYSDIYNKPTNDDSRPKNILYKYTQEKYPELLEELVMTGCHSVLVDGFKEGERRKQKKFLAKFISQMINTGYLVVWMKNQ